MPSMHSRATRARHVVIVTRTMTSASQSPPSLPSIPQRVLLTHAVLVGLTPLIPIPFLDDVVKNAVERRLVKTIAKAHGRELEKKELKALTEEPSGNLLLAIGKGIALFPFKLIFKTVFLVLEVKAASDEASACYHRGLLFDLVLRSNALAPHGPRSPAEVRSAVHEVASGTEVSPLGRAVHGAFEGSRDALTAVGRALLARIGKGGKASRAAVETAVAETTDANDDALDGILSRMAAAVAEVPDAHFALLEKQLEERLGVPLRRRG